MQVKKVLKQCVHHCTGCYKVRRNISLLRVIFSFTKKSGPPSCSINTGVLSLAVKRPGRAVLYCEGDSTRLPIYLFTCLFTTYFYERIYSKAAPLQACSGSEGSRKLRFPDFMTTAQDGGNVVSLTHRLTYLQEMLLVLISVRGRVDPRAMVRSERFYANEKFEWHQLGSNQRPTDL